MKTWSRMWVRASAFGPNGLPSSDGNRAGKCGCDGPREKGPVQSAKRRHHHRERTQTVHPLCPAQLLIARYAFWLPMTTHMTCPSASSFVLLCLSTPREVGEALFKSLSRRCSRSCIPDQSCPMLFLPHKIVRLGMCLSWGGADLADPGHPGQSTHPSKTEKNFLWGKKEI